MSDLTRDRDQAEDAGEFDAYRDERADVARGYHGGGPELPADYVPSPRFAAALKAVRERWYGHISIPDPEPLSRLDQADQINGNAR